MRWTSIAILCLLAVACSKPAPAPPPFKAIADTKLLMQAVLDPAADVIWDSAGADITADGVKELGPRTPEEWSHVRNNAVALAESGNLLMMAPRAPDRDEEWMRLSRALIDASLGAVKAADAKSTDGIFDSGGEIYTICSNCHAKYSPAITRFGGK